MATLDYKEVSTANPLSISIQLVDCIGGTDERTDGQLMCKQRANHYCTELGDDSSRWSKEAPLVKPTWINDSLSTFKTAFNLASHARIGEAQTILERNLDNNLRTWFDIHAQNTGTWRFKAFNKQNPMKVLPIDPVKDFKQFTSKAFSRDNFHCRYCGTPVIPKSVFRRTQELLGQDFLPLGRTNATRSGFYLMFAATLDHVTPWSLGGKTDLNNLVTSCWSCNYGKMNYTIEQLGLNNPFTREPNPNSSWKGLTGLSEIKQL